MANAWRPYVDMVRTALPLHDAGNYPAVEPRSHREVARPRGPIIPAKLPEITRDRCYTTTGGARAIVPIEIAYRNISG
jgi:hypothetical protein